MNVSLILSLLAFLDILDKLKCDPCHDYKNLDTADDFKRSTGNANNDNLCDNALEPDWYRITSKSGEKMPTECVQDGGRCGALRSVWMNGTFPVTGKVTNVTACTSNYDGDCCLNSMNIQIKNCSSYLVYKLVAVTSCPQRYCFGSEMPCPEGETSANGFSPGCKYEPCLPANYKTINQWERSVGNLKGGQICDNILKPGWYRPVSLAGNAMPTDCQKNGLKCGTMFPIWMNGTHPAANKISNVTACVSNYNGGCCTSSYNIQVKNCGDFYIYNLKHTDSCSQAYCFGTKIPCPLGQSSDNGFTPGCKFDPCLEYNYATLEDEVKRSSNYTLLAGDEPIDDSTLASGWYRIDSSSGNDIVTEMVTMYQCGTIYPLWMKGKLKKNKEFLDGNML
ncbi:uromodulin-like [Mytilus edulis]|uniref:uromodulin-like n=1 Tax=Mytilus edulis TaxID=6550 RepID=UPI0039EE2199